MHIKYLMFKITYILVIIPVNVCFNIIKSSVSGNIYKTSERKKTFWYFPFIIVRLI